ncbi:MAG: winged helix-turn-helix transcriptional regulator [Gammaproteobacteria bacterium]|nr:winged helix-turn-helix transcriptional regulator [Gammaproteobacteria bacterium]
MTAPSRRASQARARRKPEQALEIRDTQTVWYRLMKLTNLINRPFFNQGARPHGININEWRLLITLADFGETAAHELADASGLHPMNVSRSLALLCRQDRITMRIDPSNRRRKLFRLSPTGRALYRRVLPHMRQRADALFSLMSPDETKQLGELIDRLIARVESLPESTTAPEV